MSRDDIVITPFTTKMGDKVAVVRFGEKNITLHSKYNPQKEAVKVVDGNVKEGSEIVIIGGFGYGYIIEEVVRRFPKAIVVVVERFREIFESAIRERDLKSLLANPQVNIVFCGQEDILSSILFENKGRIISYFVYRPYMELDSGYYAGISDIIKSSFGAKEINIATMSRFEKLWTKNVIANAPFMCMYPGVNILNGIANNVPAIIVSAGPSLEKNIRLLRGIEDRFIIIAVDTVAKLLEDYGIKYHFVVAVDPQLSIYYYTFNLKREAYLVADISLIPQVIRNYKGNVILNASPLPITKWLEDITEIKGSLAMGGSVSTTAFDLARKIGANPIILVGQDLSYGDRTHIKGSLIERYWRSHANRFKSFMDIVYNYRKKSVDILLDGYYGGKVRSDKKLAMYHRWFEKQVSITKAKVINATEGGAKISGCKNESLISIINRYKDKINIDIDFLSYSSNVNNCKQGLIEALKSVDGELRSLDRLARDGKKLSQRIYNMIKENKLVDPKILKRLDDIDREIIGFKASLPIISTALQRAIKIITEDFDNPFSEEELKNDRLKVAKRSLYFYTAIDEAVGFVRGKVKKAIKRD